MHQTKYTLTPIHTYSFSWSFWTVEEKIPQVTHILQIVGTFLPRPSRVQALTSMPHHLKVMVKTLAFAAIKWKLWASFPDLDHLIAVLTQSWLQKPSFSHGSLQFLFITSVAQHQHLVLCLSDNNLASACRIQAPESRRSGEESWVPGKGLQVWLVTNSWCILSGFLLDPNILG